MSVIVKRCACGLDYTAEEWSRLPLVGYYDDDALDAEHPQATTLELRNCMCRSTLTVEKPRRKAYVAPRLVRLAAKAALENMGRCAACGRPQRSIAEPVCACKTA